MNRHDDDPDQPPAPNRMRAAIRGEDDLRDPYEARRYVRTYGDDDPYAAAHPWQAAHPHAPREGGGRPPWNEQPARYGGGYRADERSSARPGDRHENDRHDDSRSQAASHRERGDHAQSNSGYDASRAYEQGRGYPGDERRTYDSGRGAHDASRSAERHAEGRGGFGAQDGRTDTYGSAGFRQQGKRYWFDESDQLGRFRGTQPRGYQRSDERLRELICERLTDADLDARDIEVQVRDGDVTLEGSVPARWMKHQAEDIVDDCAGVKNIDNRLRAGARGAAGERQAGSSAGHTPVPAAASAGSAADTGKTNTTGGPAGAGTNEDITERKH